MRLCRGPALMLLAAVLAAGVPSAARAEIKPAPPLPAPVVAMIDVQRILQESLAAKSVQKQLETHRAKFQAEISDREKDLRIADEGLKEARAALSADAYAAREQQLRQTFTEVEREVQIKRHALDDGFTAAMADVRKNLLDIVQDVARQRTINLVLLKQQAFWHDPALDITGEVLARLNAKLTYVAVTIRREGQGAGDAPDGKN